MTNDQRAIHRKKRIIEYADRIGNVHKTCRYFGVARSTFYLWRDRFRELGDEGLRSRRCSPHNHPNKTPEMVVDKILHLRRTYHMGPIRIVWYLERYHGIKTLLQPSIGSASGMASTDSRTASDGAPYTRTAMRSRFPATTYR